MPLLRTVAVAIACCAGGLAATPAPQFQDHEEYKLVAAIQLENNPATRLDLLDRWARLYPNSAFRQERWNQLIKTNRALGHPRKMRDLARHMIDDDPTGFGNYWLAALTINIQETTPQALEEGRRAANAILLNAPGKFSAANCPADVPLAEWYKERDRQLMQAFRTLGWVALQQKEYGDASTNLSTVVDANPSDAEALFWLGSALVGFQKPGLQSKALYYFARALSVSGKDALLPEARRLVQPYFERAYVALNGNTKGMGDFLKQAGAGLKQE
jgi:hypothetical protein